MDIFYWADGAEVDTYAEMDIDYDVWWDNYQAQADYHLYLGNNQIDHQWDCGYGAFASVSGTYTGMPYGYQNPYELYGDHTCYYEDADGDWEGDVTTYVSLYANQPYIGSINPVSAAVGSSGTISVSGYNLVDPNSCQATAWITGGTGVSVEFQDDGGTCNGAAVDVSYSISTNASTGNQ
jgi:hypothetical protein